MRKMISKPYRKMMDKLRVLSVEMGIVLFVFFSSFLVLVFLIREVFFEKAFALDQQAFDFLNRFISEKSNKIMSFFTVFGSHKFLVPANLALIGYAFFIDKNKWFGIKITSVALTSLFLMFGLKYLFGRPRPVEPLLSPAAGLSFPSGHAFMSFAFFGLLLYVCYKEIKNSGLKWILIILLLSMILVISVSRIYLRVHYLSDVIAGLCLGMMWLVISMGILNRIEKRSKKVIKLDSPDQNKEL